MLARLQLLLTCLALGLALSVSTGRAGSLSDWLSPKPMRSQSPIAPQSNGSEHRLARVRPVSRNAKEITEDFSGWRLHCVTSPATTCQFFQKRIDASTKVTMVWAQLEAPAARPGFVKLSMIIPLGSRISMSIPLVVNGRDAVNPPILSCVAIGCIHQIDVPMALIEKWAQPKMMSTRIVTIEGKVLQIPLDPRGFSVGFHRMMAILHMA